ncbi:MAG: DUF885 family protein [Balneolaceae bacterium]|nr:DUF885 family protein [Balneolaceae bacterium]
MKAFANRCSLLFFLALLIPFLVEAQTPDYPSRISPLINQYRADIGSLDRTYKLEITDAYYDKMETFYQDWLTKLSKITYAELNTAEGIDFVLLQRDIKRDLDELRADRQATNDVRNTITFASIISSFEQKRRVGTDIEGQALAKDLNNLSNKIKENEQQLKEADRLTYHQSRKAVDAAENLREVLQDSYEFYDGYDPDVTWWAEKPYKKADSLLGNYISFLEEWRKDQSKKDDGSGIIGNPIGRDEIIKRLEYEMIDYTPQELIKLANKEFEWCQNEMIKASRDLGYGDDWRAALEHVKETYVPAGKQPEAIYDLATGATQFLEERDLLTIPELAKNTWRMNMMSPQRQLVSPFFLGGEVILISYPTNTMEHDAKMMSMRGNNPNFSKATVHHELIAGHHLQGFMNSRYKSHRYMFYTPFWVEGWALYWELRLWDMGFPETPEERIGMLFWRMHRSARITFSLSYHLGEMSPQESIDLLVNKVGHEYANAEAEVRRSFTGNYGPLYQIAYLVGGLQFRALHHEFVTNGSMTEKQFHDTVLQNGTIPVDMVRHVLMDQKPEKEYQSNWDFYISSEEISRKY